MWCGAARLGAARRGTARQGTPGRGLARQGKARRGQARLGWAGQGHRGKAKAGLGLAGLGMAWHGPARQGRARRGKELVAWLGPAWLGWAGLGRAGQGTARHGLAGRGTQGMAWPGKLGRGEARLGLVWQGKGLAKMNRTLDPAPSGADKEARVTKRHPSIDRTGTYLRDAVLEMGQRYEDLSEYETDIFGAKGIRVHHPAVDFFVRAAGTTECGRNLKEVISTDNGIEHVTCGSCIRVYDGI